MKPRPDQQKIILSMADCFTTGIHAIYCSSELTTGLRLYNAVIKYGCNDRYDLKEKVGNDWLRKNVFVPNERSANDFAAYVRGRKNHVTISPACLFVPEWGQHDYLSFWETLISTRISEVWFNENWQYSNGCTFEYMAAKASNLPTLDSNGNSIELLDALNMIEKAVSYLDSRKIDTSKLSAHHGWGSTGKRPAYMK